VIRNVVVGRLAEGASRDALGAALEAIVALDPPGLVAVHVGQDLGLREGSWDFAITNDFADQASYAEYDAEAEHNRIRAELFAPICETIVRVQFEIPDERG
jgi:hypothetical protein